MSQAPMSTDVTDNDRLLAALGYPIWPLAVVMLLMEDKKSRPFIKYHAVQALAFNVAIFVAVLLVGCCLAALTFFVGGLGGTLALVLWLATFWPAYEAYNGKYVEIPYLTKLIKQQGWISQ